MNIKQIDILVHPDYFQMIASYFPFHERQFDLRKKWEERFEFLKEKKDALLMHFSYMGRSKINQGLKDLSTITNLIEREEIMRIKRCMEELGSRFIWFGWFEIPDNQDLTEIFASHGFTYVPDKTKVRAYGEIFEVCMTGWTYNTALSLDIPSSNVFYCREDSLTNSDCIEINRWRIGQPS